MEKSLITGNQKNMLQKTGDIASSNAVSAMSKLLKDNITVKSTKCHFLPINEIPNVFPDYSNKVVGINMLIPTKELCSVLMFLPYKSAIEFHDKFLKNQVEATSDISYKEIVVLTEIGNIT